MNVLWASKKDAFGYSQKWRVQTNEIGYVTKWKWTIMYVT